MENVNFMQEFFFTLLTILSVLAPGLCSTTTTFNVLQYGAVGDGKTNDSPVNYNHYLSFHKLLISSILNQKIFNLRECLHSTGLSEGMERRLPEQVTHISAHHTSKTDFHAEAFYLHWSMQI